MADQLPDTLWKNRPLLLACEAIGWLHMTGKARINFLREHGGQKTGYEYKTWHEQEQPPFPWGDQLQWAKDKYNKAIPWPDTPEEFIKRHAEKTSEINFISLLQAGHAMASGIEKNTPSATTQYLGQDVTHTWLSTAFGHPIRNLLADPPELLTDVGWKNLLGQIETLLTALKRLGAPSANDINDWDDWRSWRDGAIGPDGWLRKLFSSTLAETRLPNNDVTLFDQSYVTAALFKSAVAGALLEKGNFSLADGNLKQKTRWRLLTVGIGADHYEARAVKIGDWTGARLALDAFFTKVCRLVEVDLAVGSLLYRDGEICVFSFPGERPGHDEKGYKGGDLQIPEWEDWLTEEIDGYAHGADLETPPYCHISDPSRSLVGMTKEIRMARETMSVPLHRDWQIPGKDESEGHVCPVCLVRKSKKMSIYGNEKIPSKEQPCEICKKRRTGRLNAWLGDKLNADTIWISEVADANDRVALVTMSLDIEPWLDGTRLDALRTQAISEWRKFNPVLKYQQNENKKNKGQQNKDKQKKQTNKILQNPIDPSACFDSLFQYIKGKVASPDRNDPVLSNLQDGYSEEENLESFFSKIVEDRSDSPRWNALDDNGRARWLEHQLFCKLASPGRIYRFWRQAEGFFKILLAEFREIAAADPNRRRVRRLVLKPDNGSSGPWEDRQTYHGRYGDAPVSLLYREETKDFLTICNLDRLPKPEQDKKCLSGITLELKADDSMDAKRLTALSAENASGALGVYHPVIPLELSPVRFRILLPLETASNCVDRAIERWTEQFSAVWDRLPLRIGVVAFSRMTPFQSVIEAARNLEEALDDGKGPETWRISACETREGVTALSIKSLDRSYEFLKTVPIRLPDGRDDLFYPYLAVEDKQVRFPLDFQHPNGQTFRHAKDVRTGDGIRIYPSKVATIFMDSAAKRFEPARDRPLAEWQRMRHLWEAVDRHAPSQTALRGAWSEIVERRENWLGPDGTWFEGGKAAWLDFARAIFSERLGAQEAFLETLLQAADDDLLDWSLEWHINVLKKQISGGAR